MAIITAFVERLLDDQWYTCMYVCTEHEKLLELPAVTTTARAGLDLVHRGPCLGRQASHLHVVLHSVKHIHGLLAAHERCKHLD